MNKYLFIIICFSFLNCKDLEDKIVNTTEIKSNDLNFFDFDKVEHYSKNIKDDDILHEMQRLDGIDKHSEEYNYLNLIGYNYPKNVNDKEIISNLVKYKFSKIQIDNNIHKDINKLFSTSKCEGGYPLACAPIYRDILIFYKQDKIIGIAKICFECGQSYILGSSNDVSDFGSCGEYGVLYEILKGKK
ncbi:MAG: hypothetical protein KBC58_02760 [Flavobacterium sp.]|nr:hypothetical protein [Flavobacterium sp.]